MIIIAMCMASCLTETEHSSGCSGCWTRCQIVTRNPQHTMALVTPATEGGMNALLAFKGLASKPNPTRKQPPNTNTNYNSLTRPHPCTTQQSPNPTTRTRTKRQTRRMTNKIDDAEGRSHAISSLRPHENFTPMNWGASMKIWSGTGE